MLSLVSLEEIDFFNLGSIRIKQMICQKQWNTHFQLYECYLLSKFLFSVLRSDGLRIISRKPLY